MALIGEQRSASNCKSSVLLAPSKHIGEHAVLLAPCIVRTRSSMAALPSALFASLTGSGAENATFICAQRCPGKLAKTFPKGEAGHLEARTGPRYPQCIPPQAPLLARPSRPPPPPDQVGASSDLVEPRPLGPILPCNLVNLFLLLPHPPCMPQDPCLQHRQVSLWLLANHPAVPGCTILARLVAISLTCPAAPPALHALGPMPAAGPSQNIR